MNTLPSSAYSVVPSRCQATVVSRLFAEATALSPVFISRKQPVPYVFFASPGEWHA